MKKTDARTKSQSKSLPTGSQPSIQEPNTNNTSDRFPVRLSELHPSPRNPREITTEHLSRLKTSIESFGDIAGIVFNIRTGELVCGHQRVLALRERFGDLTIEVDGEAGGLRLPSGALFPIRFVEWSEHDQDAAMVTANSPTVQGRFTNDICSILSDLEHSLPNVYDALGFGALKPRPIGDPWAGQEQTDAAPEESANDNNSQPLWKDTPEAREGKLLTAETDDRIQTTVRFQLLVPHDLATKAQTLLLAIVKKLRGTILKRFD